MDTNRLRIALVITELEVGGAERCLVNVARGLDRDRYEATVYSLAPRPLDPHDQLVKLLEEEQIPVRFLDCRHSWQAPTAVMKLRQLLRHQQADVVQSFLFHANVISGWASPTDGSMALSLGIRVADPSRWRMKLERRIARRASQVVCVSQSTADHFIGGDPRIAANTTVIPNGIDRDALAKLIPADLTELGVKRNQQAITCVARLAPQKGIDRLLAVAPEMLRNLPNHVLLLVGDGPSAASLKRMAANSAVKSRILFAGWRPNVPQILMASELMILPSRWEGMPNVLLEAMACGRPVVCTQAQGVAEVLGPLSDHQMAIADNSQDLLSKALAIANQPELQHQLGRENQQRITEHFASTTMIQAYQRVFAMVSRQSRARSRDKQAEA